MANFDKDIERIVNLLNQARPKYATKQEQLAWQKGLLIAVLAYAIRNDNSVGHRLRDVIDQYNKK